MTKNEKRIRRKDNIKKTIIKIIFVFIPGSIRRADFIRKHNLFDYVGENVLWQPRTLPTEPKHTRIHNNVQISTGVRIFNHDGMWITFRNMFPGERFPQYIEPIEIMDNVMIGGNVIILPGVRIGPNALVAAGSVVTKDVPPGSIVGGNPAKVIGSFDTLLESRRKWQETIEVGKAYKYGEWRIKHDWEVFEERHDSGGKYEKN